MKVELLVLANSAKRSPGSPKPSGRCIAGVDIKTGQWIRPVPDTAGSQIQNESTKFNDEFIRPGDLIRLELRSPVPQIHHPENYLFNESEIEFLERNCIEKYSPLLAKISSTPNILLENSEDHILHSIVKEGKLHQSLGLVKATEINFYDYYNTYGKKKYRVEFKANNLEWNIANTDDKGRWSGSYSEGLICISLAEFLPEMAAHYKLAAGFIPVDLGKAFSRNKKSLEDIVKETSGHYLRIDEDPRLHLEDWFFQSEVNTKCLYCAATYISVFRSHEVKASDKGDIVLHRFAIACEWCQRVYTTPLKNEKFRKELIDASELRIGVKKCCPTCLGEGNP